MKSAKWLTIVYPESAPEDWEEKLEMTMLDCCISPLHDRDKTVNGDLKKPHYHVILLFDGPTTYRNALSVVESIGGVGLLNCQSVKGSYDYLTHKNNKKKAQYNPDDITFINRFEERLAKADDDNSEVLTNIMQTIDDYKIYSYSLLCQLYRHNLRYTSVIINHKYHILQYMKSVLRLNSGLDNPNELSVVDDKLLDGDGVVLVQGTDPAATDPAVTDPVTTDTSATDRAANF